SQYRLASNHSPNPIASVYAISAAGSRQAFFEAGSPTALSEVRRAKSRENSLLSRESAGNSASFAKISVEKALELRALRQNSLHGRAGNFSRPSREYAGNFSRGQGIANSVPHKRVRGRWRA